MMKTILLIVTGSLLLVSSALGFSGLITNRIYCEFSHPAAPQRFVGAVIISETTTNLGQIYCEKWAKEKRQDPSQCKLEGCHY